MTKEKVIIREAQGADAQAILDFLAIVSEETDNLLLTPETVNNLSLAEEELILKESLKNKRNLFLLAIKAGQVVGTSNLQSFERERIKHRGTFGICIRKEYWGQGIGGLMINELITFAKAIDLKMIELEVRADNQSAIHLYKKIGFKEYGKYDNCLLINNKCYDCLLMSMALS